MSAATPITGSSVLSAARDRGVSAFDPDPSGPIPDKILLASLGLDLRAPDVRAALLELHRRGEIVLARVDMLTGCRLSLIGRGVPSSLLDESEIRDSVSTFHAVLIPAGQEGRAA